MRHYFPLRNLRRSELSGIHRCDRTGLLSYFRRGHTCSNRGLSWPRDSTIMAEMAVPCGRRGGEPTHGQAGAQSDELN